MLLGQPVIPQKSLVLDTNYSAFCSKTAGIKFRDEILATFSDLNRQEGKEEVQNTRLQFIHEMRISSIENRFVYASLKQY